MGTYPQGSTPPPPGTPPPAWDPRAAKVYARDQARAQKAAWKAQQAQLRWQVRSMRRGSILGPLLLIGVGVVILLIHTGRIDRGAFFASYARWWPLLLVGAGILVLLEWMLDQFQMRDPERPQYRRSVGGWAVFLVLVLAFTGFVVEKGEDSWFRGNWPALVFDENAMDQVFGDKHEFDQTVDLASAAAGGTLTIVNPHGDVIVSGTSDDGRIHIAEHKTIYARSDSEAEDRAQQMAPKVEDSSLEKRISVHGVDGAHADLTITVPPEMAAVTVNANHGDVRLSSIKGTVTATANHGDVDLSAISGAANIDLNNTGSSLTARNLGNGLTLRGRASNITVSDVTGAVMLLGDFFGTTHVEHVNGAVHFHTSRSDLQLARLDGEIEFNGGDITGSQAQGPFVLTTSNRNIMLERIAGDVSVTNQNGPVELIAAPSLGEITIQNRNGSVKTTVPEHAAMAVQASTTNGQIDTNLTFTSGGDVSQPFEDRNRRTLKGEVGSAAGAPSVHITTSNSDISILRGDVQPLTPPAPPAKITLAPANAPGGTKPAKAASSKTPKAPAAPEAPAN